MPLMDPARDTLPVSVNGSHGAGWAWLINRVRSRSALCLSAILAVAKIAEDPGGTYRAHSSADGTGTRSELQIHLRSHAEGIAKDTMFTDIAGVDIVQSLGTLWVDMC